MNFYSVIIGSELLNGRRVDSHFQKINQKIVSNGYHHKGSFVIEDKPEFITEIFNFIKQDPDAVMFSFGGIGATPDDYTRECAANAFSSGEMEFHEDAKSIILDKFGKDAYPYRINMANLPIGAKLLANPITNVPGFYLEDRYFFLPGFPNMAHPMVDEAFEKLFPKQKSAQRVSFVVYDSENSIIELMEQLPSDIGASSLPKIEGEKRSTILSISHIDSEYVTKNIELIENYFTHYSIEYKRVEEL